MADHAFTPAEIEAGIHKALHDRLHAALRRSWRPSSSGWIASSFSRLGTTATSPLSIRKAADGGVS